jgi:LPS sulfotransferase NodH
MSWPLEIPHVTNTRYVICSAPRTGSTLLSEALASTQQAGQPNEYFDIYSHNEQFWMRKLGIRDDKEYVDRVVAAATTQNGVFGFKLLWHQSPALIAKLRAGLSDHSAATSDSMHALLTAKIGEPKYIWLRRQNKLAQAISYYRASQTGLWRSHDKPSSHSIVADDELDFDYDQIERFLQSVNRFDASWEAYFRFHRVKVLMIIYESFVQSYDATVHATLDYLNIPREGLTLPKPRLEQQRNERSDNWEERFREIFKARSTNLTLGAGSNPLTTEAGKSAATAAVATAQEKTAFSISADEKPALSLIGYAAVRETPEIAKGKPQRAWMDASPQRFAYRCLPMIMANQAGWMIMNRDKFAVTWSGGVETNALKIQFLGGGGPRSVVSLFGCGILTFTIPYVFRTPPGYNLYVHGPANMPKDGIAPLEGLVETDWTESTFTMNWMVTRPNHPIVFEAGEPIAMITPTLRHELERFVPEVKALQDDRDLHDLHREWAASRQRHNAELKIPNSQARRESWQRHYMRGTSIRHEPAPSHQTGMLLKDFIDRRPRP